MFYVAYCRTLELQISVLEMGETIMYNVTEFKICDRVEKMRLNSIKEINEEASDIRQDNEDLAMLKIIYEH